MTYTNIRPSLLTVAQINDLSAAIASAIYELAFLECWPEGVARNIVAIVDSLRACDLVETLGYYQERLAEVRAGFASPAQKLRLVPPAESQQ
ncbi:hypothetical protein [Cupriavidus taiwanensis]|uniref:Uncharacterized protein n=1 Tax=Cupriavidus taiwanensis TaxID=164546 RepID=A0A375J569_9BURK|nr:hypothetical protein [Cupriavidus taiwanensis]SPR99310.1 hypothetical protein CBM2634_A80242 [Cupriavidus taiwanensis]